MKKIFSALVLLTLCGIFNFCSAEKASYQDSDGIYHWVNDSSYIFFLFGNGQYGMSLAFNLNSVEVIRDDDYGYECIISGRSIRNDNGEATGSLTFRFVENYRYQDVQFVGNPRADYYSMSFNFPNLKIIL